MQKAPNLLTIHAMVCLMLAAALLAGCGQEPEPLKPKVYSQNIAISQSPQAPERAPAQDPVPDQKPVPETPAGEMQAVPEAEPRPAVAAETESAAQEGSGVIEPDLPPEYIYVWKGRIDPFMPWYEGESAPAKEDPNKRVPLSPLEKVDLSQLTLVGIVLSPSGNKALVEEGSGKGYVIMKGTSVGLNRGKVAKILRDMVIIEEATQYGDTDSSVRRKELKLQKPAGEE